ncbi:MAG TPA: bifunctional glycosyltransferase/class I SAM-dependent methyltransferase [Kiritimatiellia bacterium]|nr:bifunctional glycosyltransferase/class I SAM-dependent methyltransferase [Kiritimatiellia bacterium]
MNEQVSEPANHHFDNRGKRVGIFVIAYNAESHIEKTIARIPREVMDAVALVYIVDDCSTDETVAKSIEISKKHDKVRVIRNRVNRRYGGNQKFGYQYAIDNKLDAVVMLHADGQYAPECLSLILAPLLDDKADVVFGSRMSEPGDALRGGMPRYKYYGNKILTRMQNVLCGMSLSEFHSGYRGYNVAFLQSIPFWENSDEWHFDTEILIQANQSKARIQEVPIPTYYGSEICHVNGIAYAINCIMVSTKYLLYRKGLLYSRVFDVVHASKVKYGAKFHDPYSSHSRVLQILNEHGLSDGVKILEVGTGDASLTQRLAEYPLILDAIELDEESVALATPYCRKVFCGNLEQIESLPVEETYDIILAADVLEHIRNAEHVLSKFKRYLKKDGLLLVSLPNFVNIYVRLNVLLGRFPYHNKGILDNTHVKFYTDKTARKMLRKTGWIIERRYVTTIPVSLVFPFLAGKPFRWVLHVLYAVTNLMKGLLAYQNIYVCRNPNEHELL